MRDYYTVLKLIKDKLESDPLVNTITRGNSADLDLEKKNIYPLVHIEVGTAIIGIQTIEFDVTVVAVDVIDQSNEPVTDKFIGNDNEIDILNSMLAVCNRLFKSIAKIEDDFAISANPVCEEVMDKKGLTTGWSMNFQIEVPNTEIAVC